MFIEEALNCVKHNQNICQLLFLQQESDMLLQKNNSLSHDARAIPQGTLHLTYPVGSSDLSYVEYAGDMMGPCLTHSLRPPTSLAVLRQYLQVAVITWQR